MNSASAQSTEPCSYASTRHRSSLHVHVVMSQPATHCATVSCVTLAMHHVDLSQSITSTSINKLTGNFCWMSAATSLNTGCNIWLNRHLSQSGIDNVQRQNYIILESQTVVHHSMQSSHYFTYFMSWHVTHTLSDLHSMHTEWPPLHGMKETFLLHCKHFTFVKVFQIIYYFFYNDFWYIYAHLSTPLCQTTR